MARRQVTSYHGLRKAMTLAITGGVLFWAKSVLASPNCGADICRSNEACVDGECREFCQFDAECGAGLSCAGGICRPEATGTCSGMEIEGACLSGFEF